LDGDGIGFSFGLNFFLLPLLFAPVVLALASLVDDVSVSFPVEAAASSTVITSPRPADDDDVADEEEDGGGPIRDAAEDGMAWAGLRRALFGHDVGEFLSSEKIQTHNMYQRNAGGVNDKTRVFYHHSVFSFVRKESFLHLARNHM
jgi:hypothetical protein